MKLSIEWKDLTELSKWDVFHNLTLSIPWLLASWVLYAFGYTVLGLGCSFRFFMTGLRQVHDAYHYLLGVSRVKTEALMFVQSVLMLGSMHAIQINHLRHHRLCMQAEDIEAMSARMPAWRAILMGPFFPWRLHKKALAIGTKNQRAWIGAELLANVVWVVLVFVFLDVQWLKYHVCAMAIGQCLTSFFAVWTVHHDCPDDRARTIRGKWRGLVSYNLFFHAEHHLFPRVPSRNLPMIAQRLDKVAPHLTTYRVF